MAVRNNTKKPTKKSTKKPTKKPATSSTKKPRKSKVAKKKKVVAEVDDLDELSPQVLYGELFWEYRAKFSEWEKAFMQSSITADALTQEKADLKYKKLMTLFSKDEEYRKEVKRRGIVLKAVQERVAKHLGVSVEDFLKKCVIDDDTGVVRFID